MQTHPHDALTLENGAQLIFTPCPGTKEATLIESVSTLRHAGASMLITLMFDEEITKAPLPFTVKVALEERA